MWRFCFFFLLKPVCGLFLLKNLRVYVFLPDLLWFFFLFLALHFSQLLATAPVLHRWCTSPRWRHSQEQSTILKNKIKTKHKNTSEGKKPVLVEFFLYSQRQDFLADILQHLGTECSWLRAGKLPLSTSSLKEIFLPLGGKAGGTEEWPYV